MVRIAPARAAAGPSAPAASEGHIFGQVVVGDQIVEPRERPTQKANESKEKFNERQADYDLRMDEARNKAEVIIAKQRHGPTGTAELQFRGEFTRFSDLISDDHLPDDVPF